MCDLPEARETSISNMCVREKCKCLETKAVRLDGATTLEEYRERDFGAWAGQGVVPEVSQWMSDVNVLFGSGAAKSF